jgi:hypothetical protein
MSEELKKALIQDIMDKIANMSTKNQSLWLAVLVLLQELE